MIGCDLVYPLLWNFQGTEASVCEYVLKTEYDVASAGWEI